MKQLGSMPAWKQIGVIAIGVLIGSWLFCGSFLVTSDWYDKHIGR